MPDTPPATAEITVTVGPGFTTAHHNGTIVAILWTDQQGRFYVTDGASPPDRYDFDFSAKARLMRYALRAAGGVATVTEQVGP